MRGDIADADCGRYCGSTVEGGTFGGSVPVRMPLAYLLAVPGILDDD